jgi:hypothetical protein
MISVIILTKNKSYSVLDVPTNGILVIKEQHLLCGITQSGVKMVPYGNILSPFEVFIWDNTLSLEMIPTNIWMPEGRILDFSTIELLQSQETIHPSQSGSTETFTAPTFTEGGFPVVYNLMVRGMNLTISTAKSIFTGLNKLAVDCNAVSDIGDGYQKLSLIKPTGTLLQDLRNNTAITELYDIGKIIKSTGGYTFDGLSNISIIDLPALTTWNQHTIYFGQPSKLKLLKVHSLPFFGPTAETIDALHIGGGFNKIPVGVQFEVPRSMQTVNAGGLEADLQGLITANKTPNIVFID